MYPSGELSSRRQSKVMHVSFRSALLALVCLVPSALGTMCPWFTGERTNCGYYGIDELQCQSRNCCWRPSNENGAPWCFTKVETPKVCDAVIDDDKKNCGYLGINEQQCQSRGCCWKPVNENPRMVIKDHKEYVVKPNVPWCFYADSQEKGHIVQSVEEKPYGLRMVLLATNDTTSSYGPLISPLEVDIYYETKNRVHLRIINSKAPQWEVPQDVSPSPPLPTQKSIHNTYKVDHAKVGELFWFSVSRKNGEMLYNSRGLDFEVTNQYMSIATSLPQGAGVYGLGERVWNFRLTPATYTLFNHDNGTPLFKNLYGSHPVHLQLSSKGSAHLVYMRNSNAMDVTVGEKALRYHMTGGIIDMYIATGPTPKAATRQYSEIIGKPHMPSLWALGLNQCRWGYANLQAVEEVVKNYRLANIPLDGVWVDIDYMDQYMDWTWSPTKFPQAEMVKFVDTLHENGQKFVTIVDPGIKSDSKNPFYTLGQKMDTFIKTANGAEFPGKVWPGAVAFPDFLNPQASVYWEDSIQQFLGRNNSKAVKVDGLWIDMNEISNFCDGPCGMAIDKNLEVNTPSGILYPNNPPYRVNNQQEYLPLDAKTLSMSALHHNGVREYNAHNLYGLTEAIATRGSLEKILGKRSFVLSRSTFPGSGSHTAHWGGDNTATWADLASSITTILNFQLFQVPLMGVDICGFNGATTEELCARWAALGAFYPFSRNHNAIHMPGQEFFRWETVSNVARTYYGLRSRLSAYSYTLFYHAHKSGDTVARPLFYEFPKDKNTYTIEHQFMVGPAILVSPVVTPSTTTLKAYFPAGRWYDALTLDLFRADDINGGYEDLDLPLETIGAHFRGGQVICMFDSNGLTLTDTWAKESFTLVVAMDSEGKAQGDVYLDDGETIAPSDWMFVAYTASNSGLISTVETGGQQFPGSQRPYKNISVVGYQGAKITTVHVNGQSATFVQDNGRLEISGFDVAVSTPLHVVWE